MKTALGMIVKSVDSDAELMKFIVNAEKYGHELDCVIVAYARVIDENVEKRLKEKVELVTIDIKNPSYNLEQFHRLGISEEATAALLGCPVEIQRGMVPYSFNRNLVVIEAMLRGIDVLFFADDDVRPCALKLTRDGVVTEEVDFFGEHLEQLEAGSQVTTGEYSGYNILPPALFDGMEDLLAGLQKADMLEYWQSSLQHRCLTLQPQESEPKPCAKILGGNCAIKLSAFQRLPPFFSSHYTVGGEMFLCRGEDTVLGLEIERSGAICTDIGMNPLHDTYKNYPVEPDLREDPDAQNRFYYACTGWVGRNPFLNFFRGEDLKAVREYQYAKLARGLKALAEYTSNPRFLSVMDNFEVSWNSIGRYINEYERTLEAWRELMKRSDMPHEGTVSKPLPARRVRERNVHA